MKENKFTNEDKNVQSSFINTKHDITDRKPVELYIYICIITTIKAV